MFDVLNALADFLAAVKKLNDKYELSKVVGDDYYNPGMMENLDCYLGVYNESDGTIVIRTESKGLRYENRTPRLEYISVGDPVRIVRDPENPYNSNNFMILNLKGESLGNLSADLCNVIAPLFDNEYLVIDHSQVSHLVKIRERRRYAKQGILFIEIHMHLQNIPKQMTQNIENDSKLSSPYDSAIPLYDLKHSDKSCTDNISSDYDASASYGEVQMANLEDKIFRVIVNSAGIKGAEIANLISEDKRTVNSLLAHSAFLMKMVYQDDSYMWHAIPAQIQTQEISTIDIPGPQSLEYESTPELSEPISSEIQTTVSSVIQNDVPYLDTVHKADSTTGMDPVIEPEIEYETFVPQELTEQEKAAMMVENERTLKLLEAIYSKHRVNLSRIDGTSLYKRLKNAARSHNFRDIRSFLAANGFVVDDNASESYKLSFNRVYNHH